MTEISGRVGPYRVVCKVGEGSLQEVALMIVESITVTLGALGVVYKAEDERLERVALR